MFFKVLRGLRQGDSLSLYLYILCMEVFFNKFLMVKGNVKVMGLKAVRGVLFISYLFFADYSLFFLKDLKENIQNFRNLF